MVFANKTGKREVALDTETTGLNAKKDRIIELACVEMYDRMPSGKVMNILINPGLDDNGEQVHITQETSRIHGRTDEDVKDKPTFDMILPEFMDFIQDSPLVIHNAPFDIGFLNASIERACIKKGEPVFRLKNNIVDTLAIARKQRPRAQNSIDALCRFYKIDLSSRTKHEALIDTMLLVKVYRKLYEVNESLDLFSIASKQNDELIKREYRASRKIETLSDLEWEQHNAYLESFKVTTIWTKLFASIEGQKIEEKEIEIVETEEEYNDELEKEILENEI